MEFVYRRKKKTFFWPDVVITLSANIKGEIGHYLLALKGFVYSLSRSSLKTGISRGEQFN